MHNFNASLTIYKASAGSGKTYNLVKSYLLLALDSKTETYRHILAITFTKKATAEMRNRILQELNVLAINPEKSSHSGVLTSKLNITRDELRVRAKSLLIRLMHDYSNFSVSTIDQFFQRILRSVAYELDLTGGFLIELDEAYVLDRAIDQFLEKSQPGTEQYKLLKEYVNAEILGKNKKQNIKREILRHTKKMMFDDIKDFVTLADPENLFTSIKDVEKECTKWKNNFETWNEVANKEYHSIIEKYHLGDIVKKRGNPVLFLGNFKPDDLKNVKKISEIINQDENEELYEKIFNKGAKENYSNAFHELNEFYKQNRSQFIRLLPKYLFAKEVLSKLWHLQFFIYTWNEIRDIANRENIFLLSNTPLLLKQVTEQTNTPFIYERMGQWYHHFMIDEFQDTSRYQWDNLYPFLENNIAEYNPWQNNRSVNNLIIGDVKQAIYRFRGGDWKLLHNEVKQQFSRHKVEELNLRENYRSTSTIVQFNNHFFKSLRDQHLKLEFLSNDGHEKEKFENLLKIIYSDCEQEVVKKNGGYVSIELIPEIKDEKEKYIELTLTKVGTTLKKLFEAGASPGEIAILTRKRAHGKAVIDYLLNHVDFKSLPIASDDVLTIGQSDSVLIIISILNYLNQPCEYYKANAAWLIATLWNQTSDFSFTNLSKNPIAQRITEKQPLWSRMLLADACIDIINEFKLNETPTEQIYLQQFLWLVYEFSQKQISHIQSFLNFWDEKGSNVKVPPPSNIDALRVMTIHKSKGLEFKHVIIPFLDGATMNNNEQIWIRGIEPKPEMPFLVSLSQKAAFTPYAKNYYEEMFNYLIDSLNIVYVALTRPKETLHVFTKEAEKNNEKQIENWFTDFVKGISNNTGFVVSNDQRCLEFGTFPEKLDNTKNIESIHMSEYGQIPIQTKLNIHQHLKIQHQQFPAEQVEGVGLTARQFGTVLHKILEQVDTFDDIPKSIRKMVLQGFIHPSRADEINTILNHAFDDPQVKFWFDKNNRIIRERAIIGKNVGLHRPDRIVITPDHITHVIDFKFTHEESDTHKEQVKNYVNLLKNAGYPNIHGYVWYLLKKKVEIVG